MHSHSCPLFWLHSFVLFIPFRFSRAKLAGFSILEGLLEGAGNYGNEDSGRVRCPGLDVVSLGLLCNLATSLKNARVCRYGIDECLKQR
ncbi:hypothetical protein BDV97DRAFT_14741 [Delphinella strobiligena]|nr:hypothetical protein BDV97DRAFT_14741 [Delphinella strobiligena]